ncbi:hypothetical protein P5673_031726 [Acropora cervicornis]|uniref:Uncharacterized protein n=1 Tax=Acropora cervicornis TaxID=6130 RepID=A0AAD9US98_ACRCE|nr:hypothetical protein P5673_031726 [Acropora cervicornis]
MNSKVFLVLLVLASTFMFESKALQAGMGEMERSGIKGRKRQFIASDEAKVGNLLQHFCVIAETNCPTIKEGAEGSRMLA